MATSLSSFYNALENRKRSLDARSPGSESDKVENMEKSSEIHMPKVLVIESSEGDALSKLSPFAIEKAMKGIAGEVKMVKKLRSGVLLVEVFRDTQAQNLLKLTLFASVQVKVTPHRSMNSCKGVVRNYELAQMDPDELVNNLKSQGVTGARNIMQTRNGLKRKTAATILTFAMPTLPRKIKAGFLMLDVDTYIPNPLRCFKCQEFGHHQSNCKRQSICPKCSLTSHGEEPCSGPMKCPNCLGDHPAYATVCPKWQEEKSICRTKVINNISFPEARKQVNNVHQGTKSRPSYANVVKFTKSVSTQTDITNCKCIAPENNNTEKSTNTNSDNNDDQCTGGQDQTGWRVVGQSRTKSLSPRVSQDRRDTSHRGSAGRPPEKQPRTSQDSAGSARSASQTPYDGGGSVSRQARGNAPRKKINYP